jgi:hypothetical protein
MAPQTKRGDHDTEREGVGCQGRVEAGDDQGAGCKIHIRKAFFEGTTTLVLDRLAIDIVPSQAINSFVK